MSPLATGDHSHAPVMPDDCLATLAIDRTLDLLPRETRLPETSGPLPRGSQGSTDAPPLSAEWSGCLQGAS